MSSSLANVVFNTTDLFADASGEESKVTKTKAKEGIVHIRNQQRNGRKSLTQISGLASDLDLVKIVKVMRKMFNTNGTILKDEEHGEIIQIQGDRRQDCFDFLVKYNICDKDSIKVHGA